MAKRLRRIAPWQAGKVFALIYFALGVIFVVPIALFRSALPISNPGMSTGLLLFLPFLYALFGLIFIALSCWLYNLAAKITGGVEVTVQDVTDP